MSNQIVVSADQLESINEQIVLLGIDAGHLAMALQAVQVDCAVSGGVINSVIMALSGNATISEDLSDQLDGILSALQEATDHE
ncbi:hypothetical protein [Psychrobacter sp. UBA3068]|jgi:hypothetical protein|uniref:hypothetical protein n=1 Tax=Psychrobacter sp. UBA3068 TaxID=1947349 RepID=UPI00257CCBBF|nr:hypothetical protein [Psychrobacter sp. UBA3068]